MQNEKPIHVAAQAQPDLIRFDYVNADGQPDSKMITHDEMRERYAVCVRHAYQTPKGKQQPVSGAEVLDEELEFRGWLNATCSYDDLNKPEIELARDAWQARAELAQQDADPLQGAADWLVNYRGFSEPKSLAHQLGIGYNRASRLFDAARKEKE